MILLNERKFFDFRMFVFFKNNIFKVVLILNIMFEGIVVLNLFKRD